MILVIKKMLGLLRDVEDEKIYLKVIGYRRRSRVEFVVKVFIDSRVYRVLRKEIVSKC